MINREGKREGGREGGRDIKNIAYRGYYI